MQVSEKQGILRNEFNKPFVLSIKLLMLKYLKNAEKKENNLITLSKGS